MIDIFYSVFEVAISLLQSSVFVVFCYLFFEGKFSKKKNIICCIVAVIFMFLVINIQNYYYSLFQHFEIVLYCAVMIPYSMLCLKGHWYLRLFIPIFEYLLCMSVSFGLLHFSVGILGLDPSHIGIHNSLYRIVSVIMINLVYIFILYVIRKIYKSKIKFNKISDFAVFLVIPIIIFVILLLSYAIVCDSNTSDLYRVFLGLIAILAFAIAIMILSIMVKVGQSYELKTRNLLMQREQEMYKKEIDNAGKYINEIAGIKHDMKNQIFCIAEMISSGDISEAEEMCKNITTKLNESAEVFNSKNIYLNSILNVTYRKAKENSIDIKIKVDSDFSRIDGSDLITIIGNLTDNAIEALNKQNRNKSMGLTLSKKGDYYVVIVKNCIKESVLKNNPELISNKNDKLFHGYGLKSVNNIVKKYNGCIKISEKDDNFLVSLMLEIPSLTE